MCRAYSARGIFRYYGTSFHLVEPLLQVGVDPLVLGLYRSIILSGEAVPLQAWSGPKASRKLRFPDFVTTAHDGGKVDSLTHRQPLTIGNAPGTHFC